MNGLILLNKSPGLTSFQSLGFIKKALSTGKAGHTGTLDKFASGLLVVLIGRAGKLASLFSYCKKEYEGRIRFGIETDTLDPEGSIVKEAEVPSREAVEDALKNFRGEILQAPPEYSAIHINGKRAHELSRQGIKPEMKKRPVAIYGLELASWEPPFASVKVSCSGGTYIRSLARDIAQTAGSCAHLSALTRTAIGGFHLKDAFTPNNNSQDSSRAETQRDVLKALRPVTPEVFNALDLPYKFANTEQIEIIKHGKSLDGINLIELINTLPNAPAAGIFGDNDNLIAILEQKNSKWTYGHVFIDSLNIF